MKKEYHYYYKPATQFLVRYADDGMTHVLLADGSWRGVYPYEVAHGDEARVKVSE